MERIAEKVFLALVCVVATATIVFPAILVTINTLSLVMNFLAAMTTEDWAEGIFWLTIIAVYFIARNALRNPYENS